MSLAGVHQAEVRVRSTAQGSTWRRDDRLQVSLVQLQFVPGIDHLHHRRIFVFHFLQQN